MTVRAGTSNPSPSQEAMLANPRADRVRHIRALAGRSARERSGRYLIEGPNGVREAVRFAAASVREVHFAAPAAPRFACIAEEARAAGLSVQLATGEVLDAMSPDAQGVLAVADMGRLTLAEGLRAVTDQASTPPGGLHPAEFVAPGTGAVPVELAPRLAAVFSNVRDPGNAGAVIRTADASGANIVILAGDSVDMYNPKVVRATAGSMFHLPVVTGVALGDVVAALRDAGLVVLAADSSGEYSLFDLCDDAGREAGPKGTDRPLVADDRATRPVPNLAGPTAWLFGNEAWGLAAEDRALADAVVRVPILGHAESLNLATAAAVCLYASAHAHLMQDARRAQDGDRAQDALRARNARRAPDGDR